VNLACGSMNARPGHDMAALDTCGMKSKSVGPAAMFCLARINSSPILTVGAQHRVAIQVQGSNFNHDLHDCIPFGNGIYAYAVLCLAKTNLKTRP
jgi:hypothetical protein